MATLPLSTAPRDLLLGTNNDLVITNGELSWSTGIQAVQQSCRIAIQMFAGEWFLDLDAGIPWWQSILGAKPQQALKVAEIAIATALRNVDGVTAVLSVSCTFTGPTRQMVVTWKVSTALGDTPTDVIALNVTGGLEGGIIAQETLV